jgi:methanogenic corrinoid protein MtbC1
MSNDEFDTWNLAEVEQATGLSREVLRKWEIRYAFPTPVRGERGERRYALADVRRLTLIKQLIGQGLRPRHLLTSPMPVLEALVQAAPVAPVSVADNQAVRELHACLSPDAAPDAVRVYLNQLVAERGLADFVHHHLPVFNQAIGDAWAAGTLGIHAEHHYTETVRALVLHRLAALPAHAGPGGNSARVLVTTPPGELHGLGVLALQAALVLEGADCVSLGTQTPVADVVRAAHAWRVAVVAISTSSALLPSAAKSYLQALRRLLPEDCRLWVGGQGATALADEPMPGVAVIQSVGQAVEFWKEIATLP